MATFNKFNCLSLDVGEKAHDFSADAIKAMLTNTLPVATNTTTTDITEIAAGNGYSAGGLAITTTSFTQSSGTSKLVLANSATLTATGSIPTFRYCVLYNSANNKLIGWYDYAAGITMASGDTFQLQFNSTTGAITIA